MNPIERTARRIDRFQQGFGPAAFVFGVVKKYGDDRGGQLAALIAYYGFLSIFPLLLLLVTLLGVFVGGNQHLVRQVEDSALAQFPVVGSHLQGSVGALHRNSAVGLVIGILGLVWGSQGAIQSAQFAMAQVWNVPNVDRPNFFSRLARTLLMMLTLGIFLLLSTAATAVGGAISGPAGLVRLGSIVLSLLLNVGLFITAFRLLTPKQIASRPLVPGAVLGGLGWTVLLQLGTVIVGHLRHSSEVYGFFAIVLTLVAWIYLGTQLIIYSAEVNGVLHRRLWPRSMVQPPLTEADKRVLAALGKQSERRPELKIAVQHVGATADDGGETPAAEEGEERDVGEEADRAASDRGEREKEPGSEPTLRSGR